MQVWLVTIALSLNSSLSLTSQTCIAFKERNHGKTLFSKIIALEPSDSPLICRVKHQRPIPESGITENSDSVEPKLRGIQDFRFQNTQSLQVRLGYHGNGA